MIETRSFDAAEYLDTQEAQAEFLAAAFETGDTAHVAAAIGVVARARGMTEVAKAAGVTRRALYKALSETGDPKLSTLLSVLRALGLKLKAEAA